MQLRGRLDADLRRDSRCAADGVGPAARGRRDARQRPRPRAHPRTGAGQSAALHVHGNRRRTNAPFLGGGGPAPTPTVKPFSTGIFGDKPQTTGPIVGVRIALHKKALRKWRDHEFYDEWRFIAGDADNDLTSPIDPSILRGAPRLTPKPGVP